MHATQGCAVISRRTSHLGGLRDLDVIHMSRCRPFCEHHLAIRRPGQPEGGRAGRKASAKVGGRGSEPSTLNSRSVGTLYSIIRSASIA